MDIVPIFIFSVPLLKIVKVFIEFEPMTAWAKSPEVGDDSINGPLLDI